MLFGIQTFRYTIPEHGEVVWNIQLALEKAAQRYIRLIEAQPVHMDAICSGMDEPSDAFLDTVDPSQPGIAAPLIIDQHIYYILIDGQHRCRRAQRDKLRFFARALYDDDARACVLHTTNWDLIP